MSGRERKAVRKARSQARLARLPKESREKFSSRAFCVGAIEWNFLIFYPRGASCHRHINDLITENEKNYKPESLYILDEYNFTHCSTNVWTRVEAGGKKVVKSLMGTK